VLCGALSTGLCACSSDATTSGGGGATAEAGATSVAGANTAGGAGGSAGSNAASGASGGGAAGAATAGGGAGAGGAGTAGAAGSGGTAGTSGGAGGSGGGSAGSGNMDCAGNALSLTMNGTGTASDSAKSRVVIDMMSDLPIGNSDRTVELWAYMKQSDWTANTNTLFFYGPDPSARDADGFGLDFGSTMGSIGTIDPFTNAIFDNDNQPSGVTVTMNQWVHFAMTWNGTAVQAYVNGILKATMAAPSNSAQKVLKTGSSPLTIGGYPAESAYFAGYIDEFRVWNIARSASDITSTMKKTLVGNEAGLVGYWQFNEDSGSTVADSVTTAGHTAHNGTLMAASPAQDPIFIAPIPPAPVSCP
jgi:hypothetical protein